MDNDPAVNNETPCQAMLAIRGLRQRLAIPRVQAAVGLAVLAVVLVVFLVALFQSKAGEIGGALGSVLGGFVGAGGAVWAVYLALSRQRDEEVADRCTPPDAEILSRSGPGQESETTVVVVDGDHVGYKLAPQILAQGDVVETLCPRANMKVNCRSYGQKFTSAISFRFR